MHYKNLAFAALAGIVLLSSCVKDLETKSVTDIRNAKLEEIKSQTALNNAEAAAKKTLADAEALLMAAQADAQKAQAEYIKAQAAYQQAKTEGVLITNQQKAAELETALIKAEIAKEKAQAKLDNLAMQLEKDFLTAQKELLEARAKYNSDIADAYASATSDLLTAQKELAGLKIDLTSAEQNLVDLQTSKEKMIEKNNKEIASLEKLVAAYTDGMTKEEIAAKEDELIPVYYEKSALYQSAMKDYTNSENKLFEARTALSNYKINNKDDYYNNFFFCFSDGNYYYWVNSEFNTESGDYDLKYLDVESHWAYTPFITPQKVSTENWIYSNNEEDGKEDEFLFYYDTGLRTYEKAKILDTKAPANIAVVAKENITPYHEDKVASTQTSINEAAAILNAYEKVIFEYEADTKSLYEELEKLEKEEADAEAAYQVAYKPYLEYLAGHNNELYKLEIARDEALAKKNAADFNPGVLEYRIWQLSNRENTAEYGGLIEEAENEIAEKTKEIKNQSQLVQGYQSDVTTAQTKVNEQNTIVASKLAVKDAKYAAYREKLLASKAGTLADPAQLTTAKNEYEQAKSEYNSAVTTLSGFANDLTNKQTLLGIAQGQLDVFKNAKAQAEEDLKNYKAELEETKDELAQKTQKLEEAKAAYEAAEAKVEAAREAVDTDPVVNEELKKLSDDLTVAENKKEEVSKAISKVGEKIQTIESKKKEFTYSYVTSDGIEKNYDGTATSYQFALDEKTDYEETLIEYKDKLTSYNDSFAEFNKQIDEWVESFAGIIKSETSYGTDVDALNELEKATLELYKKQLAAENDSDEVYQKINALYQTESDISRFVRIIEDLKDANKQIVENITTEEQLIAEIKVDIANKEQEIKVLEKKVEELKAALDAALAEEENTTEE